MSNSSSSQCTSLFRPFTRSSLARIKKRISTEQARKRSEADQHRHHHIEEKKPIATLEAGLTLPKQYEREFPADLIATPIEDLDKYYEETGRATFMVVSKNKDIFRFSAAKAMYILDPFNPIRRVALYMLVHPFFSFLVIVTILTNCVLMTMKTNETIESTEIIFTTIYTFESCLKVVARGFIFHEFSYLRDPWNWLDFVVIAFAYMTMVFQDLGSQQFSALRTFRVLRALKTVAIVPGMKTIVGAVIESVKNLKDVIILTCFSLSVFALLGLQIYMGVLTQKCILLPPKNLTDAQWEAWNQDQNHWMKDNWDSYILCSNSSYGQLCNSNISVCLAGYGSNPDYNYTNFDNFGWALLCAFRLMTQDYWETLYQMILRTTGPWHCIFFMFNIFLGSIYLINLILAIVAMSYDDLSKKASEEEQAAAEEEAAYQEQQRLAEEEQANSNVRGGYLSKAAMQRRKSRRASSVRTVSDYSSAATSTENLQHLQNQFLGAGVYTQQPRQRFAIEHPRLQLADHPLHLYQPQLPQLTELQSVTSQENESISPSDKHKLSTKFSKPSSSLPVTRNQELISAASHSSYPFEIIHQSSPSALPIHSQSDLRQRRIGSVLPVHQESEAGASTASARESSRQSTRRRQYRSYDEEHEQRATNLPFADDESGSATSMSEPDDLIVPVISGLLESRQSSYTSHLSRLSYSSHSELPFKLDSTAADPETVSPRDGFGGVQTNLIHNQTSLFQNEETTNPNDYISQSCLLEDRSDDNPFLVNNLPSRSEIKDVIFLDQPSNFDRNYSEPVPFNTKHFTNLPPDTILLNDDLMDDEMLMLMEEERATLKQQLAACCLRTTDILCVWHCCWCWIRVQELFALLVFDPFMELFITLCIVTNTLFMAMDHDNMDYQFEKVLKNGNLFFTSAFAIEAVMKLVALSPKFYFREGWNVFDFIIVVLSLLELGLDGVQGLSVLRSFRLLRVFKLAKSWPTLNLLLNIIGKTVGDLGNLTFVLGIIIYIFAVVGMQMFGSNYEKYKDRFPYGMVPRWNFSDFLHSFMIVFRVLCGEWIQSMWDCLLVSGWPCIPFFLSTVVIGYLVVLNLFLALLLSSFGASNLSAPTSDSADTKKLQEAFDRFARANKWVRNKIMKVFKLIKSKTRNQIADKMQRHARSNELDSKSRKTTSIKVPNKTPPKRTEPILKKVQASSGLQLNPPSSGDDCSGTPADQPNAQLSLNNVNSFSTNLDEQFQQQQNLLETPMISKFTPNADYQSNNIGMSSINRTMNGGFREETAPIGDRMEATLADIIIPEYPADCFPENWYERVPCCLEDTEFWRRWKRLRNASYTLVEHKYFETVVIILILLSSTTLALEDVYLRERKWLQDILVYVDQFFTTIFFFEMLLKWLAYGFRSYFSNAWCWLDFVIVMVSVLNLGASFLNMAKIQAFKTMRTLRALRPLRAMSRMQGMRVVVNALVQAIPSIFNVLLVCLIFWLIFAIMGVQLFVGKFSYCEDPITNHIINYTVVYNKSDCAAYNMQWTNPEINFDNVLNGYLSLFQVATFKGWTEIMYHAIDSSEKNQQPIEDVNIYMYLYFVFFIILGAFFTLNLFIGVIIDNFNEQKKKAGGSLEMFMSEDQKKYYNAMKKMKERKPIKAIPRPRFKLQAIIFDITTNKRFDMIIMFMILANMVVMALDQFQASEYYNRILESFNLFFIAVFTAECMLKLFALRYYYFKEPWNLFDFVVVVLSIVGTILKEWIAKVFFSPTLLRVVRVVKIGRILRLVKGARGIRTLLFALAMSLPALFNICLLLFLVMFIYAIFGMSFFMNVKKRYGIDDVFNFSTFFKSFILLFQMCTSAGWDGVLAAIMDDTDCLTDEQMAKLVGNDSVPGDCGSKGIAIAYLVSYLIISFLVIINMYIAVILENYSQAKEDVQEGLTDEDYDMFYEIWQKFDPKGTQFIHCSLLSDFLDALEEPLQIPKPNKYKIVSMDIPICKDDLCYCVAILDALTKDFFLRKGHAVDEHADAPEIAPLKDKFEHVSSTLWRQREDYCAKIIQTFYRKSIQQRGQRASRPAEELVRKRSRFEDKYDDDHFESFYAKQPDDEITILSGSFRSLNRADESAPLNLVHQPEYSSLKQMNPFEEQQFYEWEKKRKGQKGIRRRRRKKKKSSDQSTVGFQPPASSDPDSVIIVHAEDDDDTPTNESTSRQSFY